MTNRVSILTVVALAASLLAPRASHAAEDGSLWEVSTQMDMGGMPEMQGRRMPAGMMAAMGARTTQVCRGEDPREDVTKNKDMKDCEIKDFKQSGSKVTMSIKCKEGRSATMEYVYNKARTEYKGTMHMSDPKHGDMAMSTTGKKLGPCDVAKAGAERQARNDRMKAQADAMQAQGREMSRLAESQQIDNCAKAVERMDPNELGFWGSCYRKKDAQCAQMEAAMGPQQPKVAQACKAKAEEFCKRFQTMDGYQKLQQGSRLSGAEQMCGVKAADLRPGLCKSALKSESWEFVGANCEEEAKPLAKQHCAGRSYTAAEGDPHRVEKKWRKFCVALAGRYAEGDETAVEAQPSKPESAADEAQTDGKAEAKKAAKKAAINALKGLFGH